MRRHWEGTSLGLLGSAGGGDRAWASGFQPNRGDLACMEMLHSLGAETKTLSPSTLFSRYTRAVSATTYDLETTDKCHLSAARSMLA